MLFNILYIFAVVISYFILLSVNEKHFERVFMIFAFILGLLVQYQGYDGDISRYLLWPEWYHNMSWGEVFLKSDYLLQIFAKLFSYITVSPRIYGIVMYLIYAKLYIESFKIITNHFSKNAFSKHLYIIGLFVIIPFPYFNALRFAIALLLYLLCILEIFITDRKIFMIIIFLSPLIHFSFWIMIPLPFISLLLKDRMVIAIIALIVSIFVSGLGVSTDIVAVSEDVFTENIAQHVAGYGTEEVMEKFADDNAAAYKTLNFRGRMMDFVVLARNYTMQYVILLISIFGLKEIKKDKICTSLFILLLYTFASANIASSVSHGGRFFHFATGLTVFILFYIKKNNINNLYGKYHLLFDLCFVAAIFYGLVDIYAFRYMFDFMRI